MQQLALAVEGRESALDSPPRFQQPWRHIVRERLAEVCESLTAERTADGDSWLSARAGHLQRERNRLLVRLSVLGTMVAEASDLDAVRTNMLRLVPELHHHQQRMNDLVYDAVSMDVGGSE
jgi:uncharacterized NAD(P)/FAD-binding protein YdhS